MCGCFRAKITNYFQLNKTNIMSKKYKILTINPGSTSTKIGVFENEEKQFELTIRHSTSYLEKFGSIWEQYNFRKQEIVKTLEANNFDLSDLDAVVGRGGLLKPIPNGTYVVDEEMIQDARVGVLGQHASNLGCVIAYSLAWEYAIPSYIVDPPSVDDLEDLARISGHAKFERTSLFHALNIFATARNYAKDKKKDFKKLNLIVAHMGGGVTVAALENGRAINVNNGLQEGPFSPERSGDLPPLQLLEMAYSGEYTYAQMKKMVVGKGGLVSYFGTNKAHEIENLAKAGSQKHKLIYDAIGYQIAEAIGARATNLKGKVDGIILTGGLANSSMLNDFIKERVEHIAKVDVYPGELELEALAAGAYRVLNGEDTAKRYNAKTSKIGIYFWENLESYVKNINYIEDFLREKGYVFRKENNNLKIIYANCEASPEKAKMAAQQLIDQNVDLAIAIGSQASLHLGENLKNSGIPLFFNNIYNKNILAKNKEIQDLNYFATTYGVPVDEQFEKTVLKNNPNTKKIGVTYCMGELQSDVEHDEIREFCKKNKIECVSYNVQSHKDLAKAADYFKKQKVEWVYLGSDAIVATAGEKDLMPITSKFPTLCALKNTVENGGLVAYRISCKELCKVATENVIKVMNGTEAVRNIYASNEKHLVVNKETNKVFKNLEF